MAGLLGCSEQTIYRWVDDVNVPVRGLRVAGKRYVLVQDVIQHIGADAADVLGIEDPACGSKSETPSPE